MFGKARGHHIPYYTCKCQVSVSKCNLKIAHKTFICGSTGGGGGVRGPDPPEKLQKYRIP